jgi:putative transposase
MGARDSKFHSSRPHALVTTPLMPQSLAKVYLHVVFSTKNRERVLTDDVRPRLHSYMGGVLNGVGCSPVEINTEPDHAHVCS